jgi:hypothetical protein
MVFIHQGKVFTITFEPLNGRLCLVTNNLQMVIGSLCFILLNNEIRYFLVKF